MEGFVLLVRFPVFRQQHELSTQEPDLNPVRAERFRLTCPDQELMPDSTRFTFQHSSRRPLLDCPR